MAEQFANELKLINQRNATVQTIDQSDRLGREEGINSMVKVDERHHSSENAHIAMSHEAAVDTKKGGGINPPPERDRAR